MIEVRRTAENDSLVFDLVVREGKGETRHHVIMSREMCERLTAGKHTPERCVEAAFRFLLDREPKEITPRALRRDRDLALLPRVRAGDAALLFTVLIKYACRVIFSGSLAEDVRFRGWSANLGSVVLLQP